MDSRKRKATSLYAEQSSAPSDQFQSINKLSSNAKEDSTSSNCKGVETSDILPENDIYASSSSTTKKRAKQCDSESEDFSVLEKYLGVLSKEQLVSLISNLGNSHPHIYPLIHKLLPKPTIPSIKDFFLQLEQKLMKSFPYNRNGNGRDDYSFNRVKSVLIEIKDYIISFASYFSKSPSDFPHTSFDYLHLATQFAASLPEWDNPNNNLIRIEILTRLKAFWRSWMDNLSRQTGYGRIWGRDVVQNWWESIKKQFPELVPKYDDLLSLFKANVGWVIGLAPQPSNSVYPFQHPSNQDRFSNSQQKESFLFGATSSESSENYRDTKQLTVYSNNDIPTTTTCSLSWNTSNRIENMNGPGSSGTSVSWGMSVGNNDQK